MRWVYFLSHFFSLHQKCCQVINSHEKFHPNPQVFWYLWPTNSLLKGNLIIFFISLTGTFYHLSQLFVSMCHPLTRLLRATVMKPQSREPRTKVSNLCFSDLGERPPNQRPRQGPTWWNGTEFVQLPFSAPFTLHLWSRPHPSPTRPEASISLWYFTWAGPH